MNQEWFKILEKKLDQIIFLLKSYTHITNLHELNTLPCSQCETEIQYFKNLDGSINRICKCFKLINDAHTTNIGDTNAPK